MNHVESRPPRLLFAVKDAAHALGVGQTKIWELIKTGQLDTRRIGSRRLVTEESLRKVAEAGVPVKVV